MSSSDVRVCPDVGAVGCAKAVYGDKGPGQLRRGVRPAPSDSHHDKESPRPTMGGAETPGSLRLDRLRPTSRAQARKRRGSGMTGTAWVPLINER